MANQVLYGGFRRLGNFPLDPSSIFKTYNELEYYISHNPTAYDGQIVVVTNDTTTQKNNGLFTIHVVDNAETGEKQYKVKQSVDMTNLAIAVREAVDEKTGEINKSINILNKLLGITESDNEEDIPLAENNILSRVEKIEKELLIHDDNSENDILVSIKKDIENIKNSTSSLDKYATTEALKKVSDDLSRLKTIVDLLDNGSEDNSINTILLTLTKLSSDINTLDSKFTTQISNLALSVSLLTDNNTEFREDLNKVEDEVDKLEEAIKTHTTDIGKMKEEISYLMTNGCKCYDVSCSFYDHIVVIPENAILKEARVEITKPTTRDHKTRLIATRTSLTGEQRITYLTSIIDDKYGEIDVTKEALFIFNLNHSLKKGDVLQINRDGDVITEGKLYIKYYEIK